MDSATPSPSILESLRTVEFRLGLKGYNVDEVDEYLEKAAVEAEALHEQYRQANERLRQATERISQLEAERRNGPIAPAAAAPTVSDDSLQRTLLLAQKFVDQAKRESEAEAAEVVAQAEEKARATVAQADEKARATVAHAEEQARQLTTDADRRLREEVTRLEAMRGQLAGDVENIARHLEAERTKLRTSLSEVLKWVDDNIQPANSLMVLRSSDEAMGADDGGPPDRTGLGLLDLDPAQGQLDVEELGPVDDRADPSGPQGYTADSPAGDRG